MTVFGDRITERPFPIYINWPEPRHPARLQEAVHRAILARREPH